MTAIIVTGARGYIGGALAKRLAGEGHALRLVSRAAAPSGGETNAAIRHVQADLRDEASWSALLTDAAAIIHLSSRTDLRAAEADPACDRNLNVAPIAALVRAIERNGRQMPVIFASTVTIVGDRHANPVNETTPDRPCSTYDRHKLECENILREATRRGVLHACSLRLSNVYGYGGQSINTNRGVLNTIMQRAGQGKPVAIYGEGEYVRDFTHLSDVVNAFYSALVTQRVRDGRHYVIATGQGHTLAGAFDLVAKEAFRVTGRRVEIKREVEPPDTHAIERRNFVGDSRLFSELTNWRAVVDLQSGIRDYFKHAKAALHGAARQEAV